MLRSIAAIAMMTSPAFAQETYGAFLEGFAYPHEVRRYEIETQHHDLQMAYMDIAAQGDANGRTVLLLHGKNFCAATWVETIDALASAGYRVVAPDQIGFCKSSKPERYQYSLHQLAQNTRDLLASLDVGETVVMGHSMGGMLAMRYALMFPETTSELVLVNPIGLEDWKAKGVPWQPVEAAYEGNLETTAEGIKSYQLEYYYANGWEPRYDQWVEMQAGMYHSPDATEINAWAQALTSDMIFTQPVVHELGGIEPPTTLMIGMLDTTAPGAARAPEAVADELGDYPSLSRTVTDAIPNAELVAFDDLGHSPHIEAPDRFHDILLDALR